MRMGVSRNSLRLFNTPNGSNRFFRVWASAAAQWLLMTSLLMTAALAVELREVNMLSLAWLSQNGLLTNTEQYFASFMLLPVAVKHFNERDNTIIPDLSSRTKNCNATIRIFGGEIKDGRGLQNIAMRHLVEAHRSSIEKPDIIHGPTQSDVSYSIKYINFRTVYTND